MNETEARARSLVAQAHSQLRLSDAMAIPCDEDTRRMGQLALRHGLRIEGCHMQQRRWQLGVVAYDGRPFRHRWWRCVCGIDMEFLYYLDAEAQDDLLRDVREAVVAHATRDGCMHLLPPLP